MTDTPEEEEEYVMTTQDYHDQWDTMDLEDRAFLHLPSKESYTDEEDGLYVPTIEEVRARYPDIPANRNLTSDRFRKKIWVNHTVRFLDPLRNSKQATAKRKVGLENRMARMAEEKEREENIKAIVKAMKKQSKDAEELSSYDIMVMYRNHALLVEKDLEKAADISNKLLEYEKSKIGRSAPEPEEVMNLGKATDADLDAFNNDEISAEEFQRRMLG